MKAAMAWFRILVQLSLLAALASCGGGGSSLDHPPSIAGLRYSPATAVQAPGGWVAISGAIDFVDGAGDVASMRLVSSAGADLTVATDALAGMTSGTAAALFLVAVDQVGVFGFDVWLVDGRGDASNRLSGSFEVLPAVPPTDWIRLDVTPPDTLLGVAWNGSRFVAVGLHGSVMTAISLTQWSVQTSGVAHALRSVAASPTRFVAVGDGADGEAVVLASTDGTAWSVQLRSGACQGGTCSAPSMLSKVIWTGSQFVAVGQQRDLAAAKLYALVLTSTDGLNWTQRASRAIELGQALDARTSSVTSVAWSGSVLVAVGLDPGFSPASWVSSDAEVWTKGATPPAAVALAPWDDVTFGHGRFVAVGGPPAFDGDVPAFSSVDGLTWLTDTSTIKLPAMHAVAAGAGGFVAVGPTHRQVSPDGLTWTPYDMSGCGNAVLWTGSRYVAVGQSICASP